jgi:spore maturation protein CgeB
MWAPQDDGLFKPAHNKDIDISFMGQIGDYRSYRATSINHLRKSGINGFFSTEDRSAQVSHEDYASIMGRSKIVINFSQSVDGHQSKGRVMEAIRSGALLLESENNQTSELFLLGEHYISFVDEHDLLEKAQYYLINDDKRDKIAQAARSYLIENYSNNRFWSKVLDSCASSRVDIAH